MWSVSLCLHLFVAGLLARRCQTFAALMLSCATAAAAAQPALTVERDGRRYDIRAHADADADVATVWSTITDYDRLETFVPGIDRSRVVARRLEAGTERLIVEQSGSIRFWFFAQPVRVRLEVSHLPRTRVDANAIADASGPVEPDPTLDFFEAHYELTPRAQGGVRLDYRARVTPRLDLPLFIGAVALRRTFSAQFDALIGEIGRRAHAASPTPEGG